MPRRAARHQVARPPAIDDRPSSSQRGYGRHWRRLRLMYLRAHPLCVACEAEGKTVAALHVDHRLAREQGGSDDDDNLQALCASCHSKKTVAQDGGFGRPAGPR